MRRNLWLAGVLAVAGVAGGCQQVTASPAGWHRVAVDSNAQLVVQVEGGNAGVVPSDVSTPARTGETIHRVLRGESGGVLFAYDLVMKRTADKKAYMLLLSPATGGGPTFAKKREVLAKADQDLVRVELMQQPETHEKIVDIYRLMAGQEVTQELRSMSLMEMHNAVFRWFHGK
jgi:hypothetical protein